MWKVKCWVDTVCSGVHWHEGGVAAVAEVWGLCWGCVKEAFRGRSAARGQRCGSIAAVSQGAVWWWRCSSTVTARAGVTDNPDQLLPASEQHVLREQQTQAEQSRQRNHSPELHYVTVEYKRQGVDGGHGHVHGNISDPSRQGMGSLKDFEKNKFGGSEHDGHVTTTSPFPTRRYKVVATSPINTTKRPVILHRGIHNTFLKGRDNSLPWLLAEKANDFENLPSRQSRDPQWRWQ